MKTKNWWSAGATVVTLWCAATAAHAQYLGLYLSPPGEQNTTRPHAVVETFDGPVGTLGSSGSLTVGTYTTDNQKARRTSADVFGGAGDTGNYLAVSGDKITITMTGEQKYLGFWWSAGDDSNYITFYDNANNLLASFSTQTLMTFLNQQAEPSWVTAIDGKQYPKMAYYGNPNPPSGRHTKEPYAYINLILQGTPLLFGKVEISGKNFELDNFAVVSSVEVNPQWVELSQIPLAPTAPGIGVNPYTIYTRPGQPTTADTTTTQTLGSHSKSAPGDTYGLATLPQHGHVQMTDASTGAYIYTPPSGFAGEDHFNYQLCEGSTSQCVTATITVVVAPQANNDNYTTAQNTAVQSTLADNDHIYPRSTYTLVDAGQSSHVALQPDGSFTFTPDTNWIGPFTFDYQVCLPAPYDTQCDTATATIRVVSPAAPAVAAPPTLAQPPLIDTPVTGSYQYVAPDGTPEGASLLEWRTGSSSNPDLAQPVAQSLSYTPPAGEQGKLLFLCVTPITIQGTPGNTLCSVGQRIRAAALLAGPAATHAIPSLNTWVQCLLAALVLVLGGMHLRRT